MNEIEKLTLEKLKLEVKDKELEIKNKRRFKISPAIIGVLTVLISVTASFFTTQLQLRNKSQVFESGLLSEVITKESDIVNARQKIEFLIKTKTIKDEEKEIVTALQELTRISSRRIFIDANTYNKKKEYMSALESINTVLELNPNYIEALRLRGEVNIRLGAEHNVNQFYLDAVNDLEKMTKLEPKNSSGYFWLSQAYRLSNNFESALNSINKAIDLNSSSSNYYSERGLVYREKKQQSLACQNFRKALALGYKHGKSDLIKYNCE